MEKYIKRFIEWIKVKSLLDSKNHTPPFFNEREIWWCAMGENIGIEISGKGSFFRRPVLILRKLDRYSFIGAPLTRTVRTGNWFKQIKIDGRENTVILSQIRHFDYRRMDKILSTLNNEDFIQIKRRTFELILENKSPTHNG